MSIPTAGAHFNSLSPAEAERIALTIEEMGEAIQAAGKVLCHGYSSYNHNFEDGPSNRDAFAMELSHVLASIEVLLLAKDIPRSYFLDQMKRKMTGWLRWSHHQG